jgi:hypothetical protein
MEIHVYDNAARKMLFHYYDSVGNITLGSESMEGDTILGNCTLTDKKGKVYQVRSTITFAADNRTFTSKWEGSDDGGKTWAGWFIVNFTRK